MRPLTQRTTRPVPTRGGRLSRLAAGALALLAVAAEPPADEPEGRLPSDASGLFAPDPAAQASAAAAVTLSGGQGPFAAGGAVFGGLGLHYFPPEQPLLDSLPSERRVLIGASSAALAGGHGGPPAVLGVLVAGEDRDLWSFFDSDFVHPIPPSYLAAIRDDKELPKDPGDAEMDAYFLMLLYANRTSPEAFARAADANTAVGYAQLYSEPEEHHGEVVRVVGRLLRVRRFTPPPMARQGGVRDYYEGWMMMPGDKPVCVAFTELPPGLKPDEAINRSAVFCGYFFKKYRYTANETAATKKYRLAPLLIGRTIQVARPPPTAGDDGSLAWTGYVGPLFLIVLAGTGVGVFALTFWYRRSDQRVRARVQAARQGELQLPPAPAPPGHNRLRDGPGEPPAP
jgi:hypothetical protein